MGWTNTKQFLISSFKINIRLWLVYIVVFLIVGLIMSELGKWAEIARFTQWWQVITVYILYMVPISIVMRNLPWHMQYAYGLIAMGVLEFVGYALETSVAYPDNILDQWFNVRNFSLAMSLFFGFYFPILNVVVRKIARLIFGEKVASGSLT